ncbi:hypothetical protein [Halomonas smyrnensis]|uniref:hypothetical protein n=1 Tax=Halomonas smyrnensis TaxID=720605 RepID=UPI00030CB088|nr:hypothetical protein [Halomonas smyrnensis]
MELDWHMQRSDLAGAGQIELDAEKIDVDESALTLGRLRRVREQMRRFDIEAQMLNEPVNVRYACGARNMQVFSARNGMARYQLVMCQRKLPPSSLS